MGGTGQQEENPARRTSSNGSNPKLLLPVAVSNHLTGSNDPGLLLAGVPSDPRL